jgi:aspartate kinase
MRVIVQKYGGKCVEPGGNELVTAERVMETRDRGDYPVVVVSAMGRELRDPRAFIEKLMHRPEEWRDAALAHFYSTAELVRLVRDIDPDIEPRELDMLMSCGEIISTVRLAHLLKAKGYSTVALSGGQVGLITDGFFGHARVIQTEIRQLLEILDRPAIPLVAGFQGVSPVDHAITTLGEGGSDYTAVCLAYALKHAQRTALQDAIDLGMVEIYKEVDGVMTANPANFPAEHLRAGAGPRRIGRLTFDELVAMAQYGADVIQAEAARMARRYALPVAVRNYRKPADPGTVIDCSEPECAGRLVTGVADMPAMAVFSVPESNERQSRRITELLAQVRVNFRALPVRDGSWKFAVKREKYRQVADTVDDALRPRGLFPVFEEGQWALVTLVGAGLRGQVEDVGLRARGLLEAQGMHVEGEICDTMSYSVLVHEAQRTDAIILLHDTYIASTADSAAAG